MPEPQYCTPTTLKRSVIVKGVEEAFQSILRLLQRPPWVSPTTGLVNVGQPTAANLNATVSIASGQTLATVTTVTTVTTLTTLTTLTRIADPDLNRLSWAQNIGGRMV